MIYKIEASLMWGFFMSWVFRIDFCVINSDPASFPLETILNYPLTLLCCNLKREELKMKKILLILVMLAGSGMIFAQKYSGSKKYIDINERLNDEYCSGLFKSAHGTILNLFENNVSVMGHQNILDWMQGRVAGLQVYNLRNGLRIPVIRGSRATIYVDEMLMDPDYLNLLPVHDIAIIKVIRGPFVGAIGNGGGGGVIAIYTIRPESEEE
jgi:hypothetical protein